MLLECLAGAQNLGVYNVIVLFFLWSPAAEVESCCPAFPACPQLLSLCSTDREALRMARSATHMMVYQLWVFFLQG